MSPVAAQAHVSAQDGGTSFSFAGADVRQVLRAVLGEQLHLAYAVDPALHVNITADTGGPIPRDAVLPTLASVLRASGVALVQAGGIYRAVPLAQASEQSIAAPGARGVGYGIRVLPLKYVAASELHDVLKPFVPAGGALQVDESHNVLIVSGPSADLDGFANLVRRFDVNWLSGKSVALYHLQVSQANDVAREVQQLIDQNSDKKSPLSGVVRIVPVERINSIIVISTAPSYLRQIEGWIEQFDFGGDQSTPRLFEYRVQNSRAADLARVLTSLFSPGAVSAVAPTQATAPGVVAMGSTTPTSASSPQGLTSAFPGAPGTAGTAAPAGATSPAAPPPISPPSIGAEQSRISEALAGGTEPVANAELHLPPVRVVADEKNNALVIYARPRDYRMILPVIRQLDVVPMQVLIDATIAEVTLNNTLQYGVQFYLTGPGEGHFELTPATSGTIAPSDITGIFPGFNYLVSNLGTQRGIINLLRSVSKVTVLSSPELLVVDHQTAGLQVGAQVPIVVQSAQSVITAQAPIVNSIEYRNTGVVLKVTPRVNSTGMITLDIDQEVSEVAPTTSSTIDSPTINDRHVATSVIVKDGETIALGGLIRENRNNSQAGIPVLSEIPGIGPLFRSTNRDLTRDELIVLMTPRIIRNADDARVMTGHVIDQMRALRPLELEHR